MDGHSSLHAGTLRVCRCVMVTCQLQVMHMGASELQPLLDQSQRRKRQKKQQEPIGILHTKFALASGLLLMSMQLAAHA